MHLLNCCAARQRAQLNSELQLVRTSPGEAISVRAPRYIIPIVPDKYKGTIAVVHWL